MTAIIGKYAANKMLGKQMKQYQDKQVGGDTDPYFMMVEDPKKPGRKKKVKKQIPAYIPEHDATILAKMRRRSYRLDMSLFTLFGIRFGWSSVIGIIPAAGDVMDALLALLLVWRCTKIDGGLPSAVLITMLFNVGIDFGIGIVPILGDIADAYWKANTKNVRVLEKHLDDKYKPKEIKTPRWMPPATVIEEFSDDEDDRGHLIRPSHRTAAGDAGAAGAAGVRRPEPTADRQTRGGWFSGWTGSKRREPDVERGDHPPRQAPVARATAPMQETGTINGSTR